MKKNKNINTNIGIPLKDFFKKIELENEKKQKLFWYRQYKKIERLWYMFSQYFSPHSIKFAVTCFFQRRKKGFDNKDIWNLSNTVCKFLIPRLSELKNKVHGHPTAVESLNEWKNIIQKMIDSFELINDDNFYGDLNQSDEFNAKFYKIKNAKIKNGLELFAEHFESLWD